MSKYIFTFTLTGVLFFCFLRATEAVNAQEFSLKVSPQVIKITAQTPSRIKTPLTLENESSVSEDVSIVFKSFVSSQQNHIQYQNQTKVDKDTLLILNNSRLYENNVPLDHITLGAGQKKILELQTQIPSDQKQSDYYFSIIFISKESIENSPFPGTDEVKGKSIIQIAAATHVLLSVGNVQSANVSIEQFNSKALVSKGPVRFNLEVRNFGPNYTETTGEILITNMFGQTIGKVKVPDNLILNNTKVNISYPWTSKDIQSNLIWPETVLLGPYSAEVILSYKNHNQTFTTRKSSYFLALPIPFVITGIAVTILIFLIKKRVNKYLYR